MQQRRRIVVKVGTSTLTHPPAARTSADGAAVRVLSDIMNSGVEVALVTSNAIGVGVGKLGLRAAPGHPQQAGGRHRGPVRADVHV